MLAFLVPLDSEDIQQEYDRLRHEVHSYNEELYGKPHVVVLTKRDLIPPGDPISEINAPGAAAVHVISSSSGAGIEKLKEFLWKFVETARSQEVVSP